MRIGVLILPELPWSTAQSLWRRAEELGFDHAWTYDHLAWRSLRDAPWCGAMPTLAAAAGVTTRMRLGTLVASSNFRHPVSFAREIITLDDVSAGRVRHRRHRAARDAAGGDARAGMGHDWGSAAERTPRCGGRRTDRTRADR